MEEDTKAKETFFWDNILHVLQLHHKEIGWPQVERSDIHPTYMKALSNMTYRVDCKIPGVNPLLAKKFGQGMLDRLLDRTIDNAVSQAFGKIGVGPTVLFYTGKYRFEEFLNCKEFTNEDMNDQRMRRLLTYYMQELHRTQIPEMPQGSLFERCQTNSIHIYKLYHEAIQEKEHLFTPKEKEQELFVRKLLDPPEIAWLEEKHKPYNSQLVISHNDFLNGNILKIKEGELKLIDFEYSTYNFRTFDIANFLNETILDYSVPEDPYFKFLPEKRPADEEIRPMLEYYVLFAKYPENVDFKRASELVDNQDEAHKELTRLFGSQEAWKKQVEEMVTQLHFGYLLSHFWWSLWAIVMCKNPNIHFNYIEFAYQRVQDYFHLKQKFFGGQVQHTHADPTHK